MVYLLTSVFLQRSINKLSPSSHIMPSILCTYISLYEQRVHSHRIALSAVSFNKNPTFFPALCMLADYYWYSTINQLDVIMRSCRLSKMLWWTSDSSQWRIYGLSCVWQEVIIFGWEYLQTSARKVCAQNKQNIWHFSETELENDGAFSDVSGNTWGEGGFQLHSR